MNLQKTAVLSALGTSMYFGKVYFSGGVNHHKRDLSGQVVIVTGGNSGIGKQAVMDLLGNNAQVVVVARSEVKYKQVEKLATTLELDRNNLSFIQCDFADLKEVKELSKEIHTKFPKIDILLNNAGLSLNQYEKTPQGLEKTIAVNHVAPFYLTGLLWDLIKDQPDARIVNVSSIAHIRGDKLIDERKLNPDTLFYEEPAKDGKDNLMHYYTTSKLYNVLFTRGLAQFCEQVGKENVLTTSLHPGVISTDFWRGYPDFTKILLNILYPLRWYFWKTPEEGAQTMLHNCLAPRSELKTGAYYKDCRLVETSSEGKKQENVLRLWNETRRKVKELTGDDVFENLEVNGLR